MLKALRQHPLLVGTAEVRAQDRETIEACVVLERDDVRAVGLDTAAAGPQLVLLEPSGAPAFSVNGTLDSLPPIPRLSDVAVDSVRADSRGLTGAARRIVYRV